MDLCRLEPEAAIASGVATARKIAQASLRDLTGKGIVRSMVPVLMQILEHDEDHRQDHRQREAEICALLRDQLAQLPAVDDQRRGPRVRGLEGRDGGRGRDAAHDACTSGSGISSMA